jgi:hypothetical protein|tara:strand:- start:471 stop:1097 length:627 start_codon:yes stop_codon:yes gene_type:complete
MFGNHSWSDKRVGIIPSTKSVSYRSEFRVFNSPDEPNKINVFISTGGAYANQERYHVLYADPTGGLTGRGANTLSQAISDAESGERSNSKTFVIESFWNKDATEAVRNGALEINNRNPPEPLVGGCTDSEAKNYNPDANANDGSCEYPPLAGCTDSEAKNYNPDAEVDDGSCEYKTLADNVREDLAEIPWGLVGLGVVALVGFKFLQA